MKSLLMMFFWLPVVMMYSVNGSPKDFADLFFLTMFLIWFASMLGAYMFRWYSAKSEQRIFDQYDREFRELKLSRDFSGAYWKLRAHELFLTRGQKCYC